MFIGRLWKSIFIKKKIDFADSGVRYEGLPHVGTLEDGSWVYSLMPVRRSTPREVVFRNGSWVKSSPNVFNMDVVGRRVVVQRPDGNIYSSGSDDPGHSSSSHIGIG